MPLDVKKTTGPGEACDLARQLAMDGAELVIAAGGDGTVSETVDGLLQARSATGQAADLAIVPVGTGSDFARGLGIAADIDRLAARIADGDRRMIDAGCVNYVGDDGALASRHFVNIASLGLSGPTDRAVNAAKSGGRFSGRLVFLFHTVREMLRYRFQNVARDRRRRRADRGAHRAGRHRQRAVFRRRHEDRAGRCSRRWRCSRW